MNHKSTIFLRVTVLLIGLIVLALCAFVLPDGIREDVAGYRPILIGLYVTAVPFYVALFHTLKLLETIDRGQAFSPLSTQALGRIKLCAVVIAGLFTAGLPYIYVVADRDDAPGVLALGLVIAFASAVIAVFAAVLQRLLHSAMEIKSEHDLTV